MSYRNKVVICNIPRIAIAWLFMLRATEKKKIEADLIRWESILYKEYDGKNKFMNYGYYLIYKKEFRNLIYYRLKSNPIKAIIFRFIFPLMNTLYKETPQIGGMFIQHGFSTVIAAKSIGDNFWCNQQVTIGYKGNEQPVIEDNVSVYCGAKV